MKFVMYRAGKRVKKGEPLIIHMAKNFPEAYEKLRATIIKDCKANIVPEPEDVKISTKVERDDKAPYYYSLRASCFYGPKCEYVFYKVIGYEKDVNGKEYQ